MRLELGSRRRWIALLVVGVALGLSAAAVAVRHQHHVDVGSQRWSLRGLVDRFVAGIPRLNSEGYDHPRRRDRETLAAAFADALRGAATHAAEDAAKAGYQVVRLRRRGRRSLLVLRDDRRDTRGWGLFVAAPGTGSRVVVEVAHPISDYATERVGAELAGATGARALLVAGADRRANRDGSADVAHERNSVFALVSRVAARPGDVVVQPHGFDGGKHVSEGDVVISNGTPHPSPLVRAVARRLRSLHLDVCLFPDARCGTLGATTNVEGQSARARGAAFLHVELVHRLRDDPRPRAAIVGALAAALRERGFLGGRNR